MSPRRWGRVVAALAVAGAASLAPVAVVGTLPAHAAGDDASAAGANSAWLASKLVDGRYPNPFNPEVSDHGLMIDAVLAMVASGDADRAEPVLDRLDEGRDATQFFSYEGLFPGGEQDRVGGATAKTLVAALAGGRDPRDFAGFDLVAETESVIVRAEDVQPGGRFAGPEPTGNYVLGADEVGRVVDVGPSITYNNANTVGQALAVIGLAGAGESDRTVVDKLLWNQCDAGWFRIFYSHGQDGQLQTCDEGEATGYSDPDGDATGFALSALVAAERDGTTGLVEDIRRAADWLVSAQAADGGWGGGVGTEAPNTNSTGLVLQALQGVEDAHPGTVDPDVIADGARFIRSAQVTAEDAGTDLAGEVGAIAYTPGDRAAARDGGIDALDTWVRAGAQASLGLSRVSFADLVGGGAPTSPPPTSSTPSPTSPTTSPPVSPSGSTSGTPSPTTSADGTSAPTEPSAARPGRRPGAGGRPTVVRPTPTRTTDVSTQAPSARTSAYLAGGLVGGDHVEVTEDGRTYVDYDATADTVLALRTLGGQDAAAARASRFLLMPGAVAAYTAGAPYDRAGATYAEPTAKLLVVSQMLARSGERTDPAVARGLADRLTELVDGDGLVTDRGRYADRADSVARHAWAVVGLQVAGEEDATVRATGALIERQCEDGGFAATMVESGCATGDLAATAAAAVALNAVPAPRPVTSVAPTTLTSGGSGTLPSGWANDRVTVLGGAARFLADRAADGGVVAGAAGVPDLLATSALASGRQALGLDASDSARGVGALVRADGGVAVGGARTADPTLTLAAVPAVAGRSWASAGTSPVTTSLRAAVLAAAPSAAGPARPSAPAASSTSGLDRVAPLALAAACGLGAGVVLVLALARRRRT